MTSYWPQLKYPGLSLAAKYSSKSLTLTWWLGCRLALWIHFICQSWYLWKVIQALKYGLHFQHYMKTEKAHAFELSCFWVIKDQISKTLSWRFWSINIWDLDLELWLSQLNEGLSILSTLLFYNNSSGGKHCPYKTSILDISNKGIILGNPFL